MWPFRKKPKITEVVAARVGESMAPEADSLAMACADCGHTVLVGPWAQELAARGVPVRCLQCAYARAPDSTATHPLFGATTLRTMMSWTQTFFPDAEIPGETTMPDQQEEAYKTRAKERQRAAVIGFLATTRVIEFLNSPELRSARCQIRHADRGLAREMACRMTVLEQIGTLGDAGPRLRLLVYCIETTFNLVDWARVAGRIRADS